MIALILSLGMDTLMMSISLGMVKTKDKLKIALTFACAEALMPLIGLVIGKGAGHLTGQWAALIGGVALLAVGVWLIFFEDEDEAEEKLERNLVWPGFWPIFYYLDRMVPFLLTCPQKVVSEKCLYDKQNAMTANGRRSQMWSEPSVISHPVCGIYEPCDVELSERDTNHRFNGFFVPFCITLPDEQQKNSKQIKSQIILRLIRMAVPYVMNLQQVMIYNSFHEVERSGTKE
ncbi:manganese efflux pump MntP [Alicyclobacillus fastidiosus]|uniref:manganese efflux pump MntP n=1 Tax=Alicyclobacillus fastidiosus TaxID=392011 RepID=UPI0032AF8D95